MFSPLGASAETNAYFSWPLTLGTLVVAYAQRPMICPTTSPGQLFSFPRPMKCNTTAISNEDKPIELTLSLFHRNVLKYDVPGWKCRGVKQTVRLLTYFFGNEHLKEFKTEELMVTPEMCRNMVKTWRCSEGYLSELAGGSRGTTNKLNYRQPNWGLPECCK